MGKRSRRLNYDEVIQFLRVTDTPYLITAEAGYRGLRERADFPFLILVRSNYLLKRRDTKKVRYVLLRKRKFDD